VLLCVPLRPQLLKHHIVPPTVSQSSDQIIKQKKIGPVTVSVVVSERVEGLGSGIAMCDTSVLHPRGWALH
jgi:hypothetical protein